MVQGTFCPMGSAHPHKCPALAACPAGSAAPGFNAGAFLAIILAILIYLVVYLTVRYLLRKTASRKQQKRFARNQVGTPAHHLLSMRLAACLAAIVSL